MRPLINVPVKLAEPWGVSMVPDNFPLSFLILILSGISPAPLFATPSYLPVSLSLF